MARIPVALTRSVALTFLVAGLLAAPVLAVSGNTRLVPRATLDREILAELNVVRAEHGLPAVRPSARLSASADEHSRDMLVHGFFAHDSFGGGSFASRIARSYSSAGYRRWFAGETILWVSPNVGPREAVEDWLSSPPHRHVLLDPAWRELGISALHATAAPGAFEGLQVTVVTADFGVRTR